jgi:mRNA interferase MazF
LGEAGLTSDSVALCHQMRVLDKTRLRRRLGMLPPDTVSAIENRMMFTMGIT